MKNTRRPRKFKRFTRQELQIGNKEFKEFMGKYKCKFPKVSPSHSKTAIW